MVSRHHPTITKRSWIKLFHFCTFDFYLWVCCALFALRSISLSASLLRPASTILATSRRRILLLCLCTIIIGFRKQMNPITLYHYGSITRQVIFWSFFHLFSKNRRPTWWTLGQRPFRGNHGWRAHSRAFRIRRSIRICSWIVGTISGDPGPWSHHVEWVLHGSPPRSVGNL